jgi:hypothetical protein
MMCCDLSPEVTGCLQNAVEKQSAAGCKRCPLMETPGDQGRPKARLEVLEATEIEEYEETLI